MVAAQFEANPCREARFGLVAFSLVFRHFGRFGLWNPEFTICPCRPSRWPFLCQGMQLATLNGVSIACGC